MTEVRVNETSRPVGVMVAEPATSIGVQAPVQPMTMERADGLRMDGIAQTNTIEPKMATPPGIVIDEEDVKGGDGASQTSSGGWSDPERSGAIDDTEPEEPQTVVQN